MRTVAPVIGSGFLVQVDGVQAVVVRAWDGELVKVVRTGGNRIAELVDPAEVTVLDQPRNTGCCLECGAVWKWHGERTSHCGRCHETFEGGVLWDAHRFQTADGSWACRDVASMSWRGSRLRKVADPVAGVVTVGTWRGPKLAGGVFDE
jgi:hypothetical protein